MASGYILILAILVLGGVIAASGDRIGTRVGKARLSLFKLRPRQTATLVTIVTGSLIAASTLAVLLATSKQLRTGLFHLNQIQNKLSSTRSELAQAIEQKNQIEKELSIARTEQADAQKLLDRINKYLKSAIAKQSVTQTQLDNTQRQLNVVSSSKLALSREIKQLQASRQDLIQQRDRVKAQVNQLNAQVNQLNVAVNQLSFEVNQLKAGITQLKAQVTQRDREITKRDVTITQREQVISQRKELEKNLKKNITQRETRLTELETQLQARQTQLVQRQAQLQEQEQQLQQRQARLQEQENLLQQVEAQLVQREAQLSQRDKQLQELDRQSQVLEAQLQERDKQLKSLEAQLQEREKRLALLEREVGTLEQYYQVLRSGNVAVLRNQVLASGVLRIIESDAARQAIDQLLSQANRTASEATRPGANAENERVVQITRAQVEQLLNQVQDGRDYVVRILSAGNYVVGEKQVQVFADVAPNQLVFSAGEIVATGSAEPSTMGSEEIRKRLDLLLAASQFRARRAGILGDTIQVGDGRITTLIGFLEQIAQYNQQLDLKAVAAEDTYTSGPLKIKLEAIQDGRVIFST